MYRLFVTTTTAYGQNHGSFTTYHMAEEEAKRLWFAPWSTVIATWIEDTEEDNGDDWHDRRARADAYRTEPISDDIPF